MKPKVFYFPIFFIVISFAISCNRQQQEDEPFTATDNALALEYEDLGNRYFQNNILDSAYYFYNASKVQFEKEKDSLEIGYKMLLIARIEFMSADYFDSESTATEALRFLKSSDDKSYVREAYNLLAQSYRKLHNYEGALYYYNEIIKIADDSLHKYITQNNIANIYIDKKDYQSAIGILLNVKYRIADLDDAKTEARIFDNLGYAYFKAGKDSALYYMKKAEKMRLEIEDSFGLLANYMHLSKYYTGNNKILGKQYAQKAYNIASKLNNTDDKLEALSLIIKNTPDNESKKLSLEYITINDSIDKVRQTAKNQFAKIKYDATKEKEENLQLRATATEKALLLEKSRLNNLLLTSGIIIVVVGSGFILYIIVSRYRRQKYKEAYNTEKRIAKKVHDELANDIYNVMNFAVLKDLSDKEKKEKLISSLDVIYSRTRDISRENNSVDTGEYYAAHLKSMLSEFQDSSTNILINGMDAVKWEILHESKKIVTHRVLQEVMINMKKHSKASLVVISFKQENGKINISYSDNGIGLQEKYNFYRNGLKNVENRMESIGGTVIFDSQPNKGLRIIFKYPAKK